MRRAHGPHNPHSSPQRPVRRLHGPFLANWARQVAYPARSPLTLKTTIPSHVFTQPGSKPDILCCSAGVRFAPESGHQCCSAICPVCTENSIHTDTGRICASDFSSEHLICLIQDRLAAWAEPTKPTETGHFLRNRVFGTHRRYRSRRFIDGNLGLC